MRVWMKRFIVWLPILGLFFLGMPGGGAQAATTKAGASAAAFYKGKTLTVIVPHGPGAGYDQWARILCPYLQKYLGVARVIVINQPAGGGLVGTDQTYESSPDGLTIGDTEGPGDVFSQIAKLPGVKFDVRKFDWIGCPANDPHVMVVHAKGRYKTFAQLVHAGTHGVTLTPLATGVGGTAYDMALITFNAFKLDYHIVSAFSSAATEKATFLSGYGDTLALSYSDILSISSDARPVLFFTEKPFKLQPNVPTIIEMAKKYKLPQKDMKALHALVAAMGMKFAFFAPPGVPANRLAYLRQAFRKSVENPNLQAAAKKANLLLGYASPEALQQMTAKAMAAAPLFKPLLLAHK